MILINLIIGFITVIIFYFSTIIPPIIMYIWFLSISFVYLGVFSYIWGLCNPLLSTPYIMMNLFVFYIFIFLGFYSNYIFYNWWNRGIFNIKYYKYYIYNSNSHLSRKYANSIGVTNGRNLSITMALYYMYSNNDDFFKNIYLNLFRSS